MTLNGCLESPWWQVHGLVPGAGFYASGPGVGQMSVGEAPKSSRRPKAGRRRDLCASPTENLAETPLKGPRGPFKGLKNLKKS